jgi:hypothetical protein
MNLEEKKYWFEQFMLGRQELRDAHPPSLYTHFVNPCSEITFRATGAYCVIGNVNLYACKTVASAHKAIKLLVRSLIRVNLMPALYSEEVKKTNRIGVGLTGIFEWLYVTSKKYNWNEGDQTDFLSDLGNAAKTEAVLYSKKLGVVAPATVTMIAPTGTVSKLFGLTEGAHPPAYLFYVRWVQFGENDPNLKDLIAKGYPAKQLTSQADRWIVGFPTRTELARISNGKGIKCAGDWTPKQHFEWVQSLESNWLGYIMANQVSYTLKYSPENTSFEQFQEMLKKHMPNVKCCSVMQEADESAYEYLPEQKVTLKEYQAIEARIKTKALEESVDRSHVDCGAGGCPIDFKEK